MTINKTLYNKGILTFYGMELGRTGPVQLEVSEIWKEAVTDEWGPSFAWRLGQRAYVRTELFDFDQNVMASIFLGGSTGQSYSLQNNKPGDIVEMHALQFDPIDSKGSSFRCPSAFGYWNGEMPNAADRRTSIPVEFTALPLYDKGATITFDLGDQNTSQTVSYRSILIKLRDKLENLKWTGSATPIFRKAFITCHPTVQFMNLLKPASVIIRDIRRTVDLHNQEFSECEVEIELVASQMSQLGQEGIIGRRPSTTSSQNVGVLELEAEVRKQLEYLTRDDDMIVQSIIDRGDTVYTLPTEGNQLFYGKKLLVRLYIDVPNES